MYPYLYNMHKYSKVMRNVNTVWTRMYEYIRAYEYLCIFYEH